MIAHRGASRAERENTIAAFARAAAMGADAVELDVRRSRDGVLVVHHDPHVAEIDNTREHPTLNFRRSVAWSAETIARYDAVLIATDHDAVDYRALVEAAALVVDTRNACAKAGVVSGKVVRAYIPPGIR